MFIDKVKSNAKPLLLGAVISAVMMWIISLLSTSDGTLEKKHNETINPKPKKEKKPLNKATQSNTSTPVHDPKPPVEARRVPGRRWALTGGQVTVPYGEVIMSVGSDRIYTVPAGSHSGNSIHIANK